MKPKARVSVIIPAWNAAAFIAETLAALQTQTLTDWEAVVVDDGSTDSTADVVAGFAAQDGRIRLLRQANSGPGAARNHGMSETTAPFLLFLDSDDLPLPHALASFVAVLEARPETVGVYGLYETFGVGIKPEAPPHSDRGDFLTRMLEFVPMGLHISNFMVRRSAVEAIGGWDGSFPVCEDWYLWVRLANDAPSGIVALPELTMRIRRHGGQLSRHVARMETDMRLAQAKARRAGAFRGWLHYRWCRSLFALILAASYIKDQGRWGAGLRCAMEAVWWHPAPVALRAWKLAVR